MKEIKL